MIDISRTLFSTIRDKINKLRFLADNNPDTFKKILYLIIADDLYEWSSFRDEPLSILKLLKELRNKIVLGNYEFIIERTNDSKSYVNVNTPQNNVTWNRVWDDQNVINIEETIKPIPQKPTSFTPDPSCKIEMVYYPSSKYGGISASKTGEPVVDLNDLTTCEKMNIFINRDTGVMYYLTDECNWEEIKHELSGTITVDQIRDLKVYKGIRHNITDASDKVRVELLEDGEPMNEDINVTKGKEDLEDVL